MTNTATLKPGEMVSDLNGVYRAEKCDSRGNWYYVGELVFSRAAAVAMLIACRGKRRAQVEAK